MDEVTAAAWRNFAAAVLLQAVEDAERGDAEARRWLLDDDLAGDLLDAVGVERECVAAWVQKLEPVAQPVLEF